jgi:SAM-dependent methyltransferase
LRVTGILENWRNRNPDKLKLLDLGGHVGVISAVFSQMGFDVLLADNYTFFATSVLNNVQPLWEKYALVAHSLDLQDVRVHLPIETGSIDVVTMLAVIEHFAHTPRYVLSEVMRVLKPGGLFVVDTPNAGKFGARVGFFLHGRMGYPPVEVLYESEIPFLGHHREYGLEDLRVLLELAGFIDIGVDSFDLDPLQRPSSLKGRLLYELLYPLLVKPFFPAWRGYLVARATRLP